MLHIRLLGSFRFYINDALVDAIDSPRQQELLAYLLLYRDAPNARTEVAQVLWPDSTAAQQRTNLRQLLFTLRRRLPAIQDFLAGDEQTVGWRGDLAFTLDVADFEQALQHARASSGAARVAALEAAVAQYTGDLLPDRYEDWILAALERFGQRFIVALEELIDLHTERGEYKLAIAHAHRLLRYDPVRETTYRRLMQLHAQAGDNAAALRTYHTCVTVQAQELDVRPADATHNLYVRLLAADGAPAVLTPRPAPADSTVLVWDGRQNGRHCWPAGGDAGIGPYRIAQCEPGQRMVLERFPDYWGGWSGEEFDRIVFAQVGDMTTAEQMLRAGELDFATSRALTPEQMASLGGEDALDLPAAPGYGNWYIFLDQRRAPLDNVLVRQALAYSFPYDAVLANTNLGKGTRAHGAVPVTVAGHDPEPLPYTYDLEKAAALLAEAGLADGFEFSMGFDLVPFNMAVLPDWNFSRYDNPAYNALIDEANVLAVTDREAAEARFIKAQRMLRDDVAAIFIMDKPDLSIIASDLTGFTPNPAYGFTIPWYYVRR